MILVVFTSPNFSSEIESWAAQKILTIGNSLLTVPIKYKVFSHKLLGKISELFSYFNPFLANVPIPSYTPKNTRKSKVFLCFKGIRRYKMGTLARNCLNCSSSLECFIKKLISRESIYTFLWTLDIWISRKGYLFPNFFVISLVNPLLKYRFWFKLFEKLFTPFFWTLVVTGGTVDTFLVNNGFFWFRKNVTYVLLLIWTYFTPSSKVSIVDFEQVNVSRVLKIKTSIRQD